MFLGLQLGAQPGPYATALQVKTELCHPLFCSFSLHHHMDQLPGLDLSRSVWLVASLSLTKGVRETFFHKDPSKIYFSMSSPLMPQESRGRGRESFQAHLPRSSGAAVLLNVSGEQCEMSGTIFWTLCSHQITKLVGRTPTYRNTKAFS